MGLPLDPNQHQAMVEIPTADAEPGTVVAEMQAGYMIKDRLLRPAMVGVTKAPADAGAGPGWECREARPWGRAHAHDKGRSPFGNGLGSWNVLGLVKRAGEELGHGLAAPRGTGVGA